MSDSSTINGVEVGEDAIRLKELGNLDFKNGKYDNAIEHYTRAIGTTPYSLCAHLGQNPELSINGP
jgi:hypothetical protein